MGLRAPAFSEWLRLALHAAEGENRPGDGGIRLYFEVPNLDAFCNVLQARGIVFEKMPADMPWGWRHAYLHDPDGHQLSLYYASERRLQASTPLT
jgi:catechol 2,3-dioxygenase-like lactoylglutathione lyase family enzyme